MTIYGLDGRPAAWILSRDGSGPSTRLLQAPSRLGHRPRRVSFSGDVELFVLSGGVEVDGHTRMALRHVVERPSRDHGLMGWAAGPRASHC